MTAPPLPESPCVRCRLDYTQTDNYLGGSRFFLSYSGSSPTAGNCATLASDIAAAWNTNLAPLIPNDWVLTEVDVLDIASDSGSSGQWTGSDSGTRSGQAFAAQVSSNVEYGIARRYRGGKPRMFMPPGVADDAADLSHWDNTFIGELNSGVGAFFTELAGLSIGAIGTLAHVSLSYYKGFENVTNSSGRTRAAPTYRTTALVDTVNGYSAKARFGSQKRRRSATTF
jgi:hypothetical protein